MSSQESIGARMKREREKNNFTVEDVHLRLRIHPGVIQRLEAGELNDWPGGKTYARGFVKQYSDFLGLNSAEVLSEFDSLGIAERPVELFVGLEKKTEGETVHDTPRPRRPRTEKKREPAAPAAPPSPDLVSHLRPLPTGGSGTGSSHRYAKWLVAAMAVVVVVLAVLQISRGVSSWAERKPSLKQAVMAPIARKPVAPAKQAVPAATPAAVPTRSAARVSIKPSAQPAPAPPAPSKYLNSPAQGNYPKVRPQDRMMLEIHAVTDVWMRIQADGSVVFEAILHRGETERWLADKAFDAKLGRPEGVRIAVNGYPVGQPGAGKIKNLRFTRDGIEETRG